MQKDIVPINLQCFSVLKVLRVKIRNYIFACQSELSISKLSLYSSDMVQGLPSYLIGAISCTIAVEWSGKPPRKHISQISCSCFI